MRDALEMFAEIIVSPHLSDDLIFRTRFMDEKEQLPEYLVLRAIMRTSFQYYTKEHGFVTNIFDIDVESNSTTLFLLAEILCILDRDRKAKGELGIEGYRHVHEIVEELSTHGFLVEDVIWGLERLLSAKLIAADHQRFTGVTREDYVKITTSGFYHLNVLLRFLNT